MTARSAGRAERLQHALTELGVPHDVKEYPDAGHSFLNRINAGPLGQPVLQVTGFNYHHPSAEDAWVRILTFFDRHLRDGSPNGAPSARSATERRGD